MELPGHLPHSFEAQLDARIAHHVSLNQGQNYICLDPILSYFSARTERVALRLLRARSGRSPTVSLARSLQ
jgi:hypothetical protein